MEQQSYSLGDLVAILRRRKTQMTMTFVILMLLTLLLAFGLPSVFRSTATILVEQQEIPRDLVPSTITSYADQQIQVITQRAMTSVNLDRVIQDFDLYKEDQARLPRSELIEKLREGVNMELVSADVIDPRSGRPTQATIAFTLSFDYENPTVAQKVANELVTLYLNENLRSRLESVTDTTEFLEDRAGLLNREMLDLEDQLARFKEQNGSALPEFIGTNLALAQRTESDMAEVQRAVNSLQERRIFLQAQLMQLSPQSVVAGSSGQALLPPAEELRALTLDLSRMRAQYGPNYPDVKSLERRVRALQAELGITPATDLDELDRQIDAFEAELAGARQTYASGHPEIVRLERVVANLQAERDAGGFAAGTGGLIQPASNVESQINVRAEPDVSATVVGTLAKGMQAALIDASNSSWYQIRLDDGTAGYVSTTFAELIGLNSSGGRPPADDVVPSNPAYVQIAAQLAATEAELRSQFGKFEQLQLNLTRYDGAIASAPTVEREYSRLTRELTSVRAKFMEIESKMVEAQMAQAIEQQSKGERFTLIEPPIAPIAPHSPNRLALLLLGLVISLAGTLGIAAMAESMDNAIRSARGVMSVAGAPPLAVIPMIANSGDVARGRRNILLVAGSALAAILLALILVHLLFRPLDVLWFQILRNLGV